MTQLSIMINADRINNILMKRHLLRRDRNGKPCCCWEEEDGGAVPQMFIVRGRGSGPSQGIKFRTLCAKDFGAFESDENNLD